MCCVRTGGRHLLRRGGICRPQLAAPPENKAMLIDATSPILKNAIFPRRCFNVTDYERTDAATGDDKDN